jgi:hypothetical protein
MTATRIASVAFGLALAAYGAVLVWENPPVIIMRIVMWALVGVVLHDLGFAPLCVAALCSVVLILLAIPVYAKPGMRPDNMTVLDRNYPLGLWISLAVVWGCVPLYYVAKTVRRHSGDSHRQPVMPASIPAS